MMNTCLLLMQQIELKVKELNAIIAELEKKRSAVSLLFSILSFP